MKSMPSIVLVTTVAAALLAGCTTHIAPYHPKRRTFDPGDYAAAVAEILRDDALRTRMSIASVERARRYTWSFAAARLRRTYSDLAVRELVACE